MTCEIDLIDGRLVVRDSDGLIRGKHYSQLALWGFQLEREPRSFISRNREARTILARVLRYLSSNQIPLTLSASVKTIESAIINARSALDAARAAGSAFKDGTADAATSRELRQYLRTHIQRPLKDHQVKATIHLLSVRNGANFSVPGSGKTTVILSAFAFLRARHEVDALFVVGPLSCFSPWRTEYEKVLGQPPRFEQLAGGDIESRRFAYVAGQSQLADLYLTSFHTLQRDCNEVKYLFANAKGRFALVVDEAHYIKQLDGAWSTSVKRIAGDAQVRWILTGTPFPHSYVDAFNYFDVLWPDSSPISTDDRIRITNALKGGENNEAAELLSTRIGSLFYRVKKSDLKLSKQDFRRPTLIKMNLHERRIYDAIVQRIRQLSTDEDFRDFELVLRLRRGRMMRLRQCVSYARLLSTAVVSYEEDLVAKNPSLSESIRRYDDLELPAKLTYVLRLVDKLRNQGEKIVIWSNFVETLKLLHRSFVTNGYRSALIYGETPTEAVDDVDVFTRDKIIAQFTNAAGSVDVLVANPAACAESVSLHTTCSHAIYYDLSYKCAQYLQSLDRIHRVGGSETKVSHYHFLQYEDTIDQDILINLRRKARNMSAVIDRDYPVYSLDMHTDDDELEAYERLFR